MLGPERPVGQSVVKLQGRVPTITKTRIAGVSLVVIERTSPLESPELSDSTNPGNRDPRSTINPANCGTAIAISTINRFRCRQLSPDAVAPRSVGDPMFATSARARHNERGP